VTNNQLVVLFFKSFLHNFSRIRVLDYLTGMLIRPGKSEAEAKRK